MMLLIFIFSLLKENAGEDVIKPVSTQKHVFAGKDVTLICNYTGTVTNLQWYRHGNVRSLQWYRQYPGSKPENIIFHTESNNQSQPKLRLYAMANRGIKLMNLSESNGDVIRPDQPSVVLTEGSSITLSCTYDESAYSLHWYQQKPGSKPEFLLLIVESSNVSVLSPYKTVIL
ncbi:hypothetical protein QQF64_015154 [Cirrhinus molitorella]|uniref:Ig-like domain-containing protein n=1 Tax=Cirrhinus molitorella TaxID=172907 RepID=A0ABR3NUF7_9TELE